MIVQRQVEECGCRLVIIDSLNGYMNAMPEERFLTIQLHELLTYLGQKGVTTVLVVAQHGLMGAAMQSPVDVSYLADSVIPDSRIDYVLAGLPRRGRGQLRSARLAGDAAVGGVWPSDHFAVVAELAGDSGASG